MGILVKHFDFTQQTIATETMSLPRSGEPSYGCFIAMSVAALGAVNIEDIRKRFKVEW